MQKILKTYLRRLTNLTASNRSLLLLRLLSGQFLDLHDLDFAASKPSFDIIEDLMGRKQVIKLCPVIDSRDEKSNELSRKLRRMLRIEKFIFEEQGSKDLYVGWPFLKGRFSDGTLVRCPLMFFPVEIDIHNNFWVLRQREEVNVTLNKSFLLAYSYFNSVKIGDDLLERVFDDFDTDSTVFRTALYQLFKESPVEINFNPDTFTNQLVPFQSFRRADFEDETKNGEIKLIQEAVIGIFPQAGSQLVPDYLHLLDNLPDKDLESFFASRDHSGDEDYTGHALNFLGNVREERLFTPYDVDAYQENAIKAVKKGKSIVVQGPPGTGKSQLICNLIGDAIASGKKVLFVCQKRAAIDVVYERLAEKEITPFVGLIHDFKNDRKEIYEKLSLQVERIEEYRNRNNGLDIIHLERNFQTASRTIDRISEELEDYKNALFDESECGLSVKELYLTSFREYPVINLKQEYGEFRFGTLDAFISNIRDYVSNSNKFSSENYVFSNRKKFHNFRLQDLKIMQQVLAEIPEVQKRIGSNVKKIIDEELSLDECMVLRDKKDVLRDMFEIIKEDKVFQYFKNIIKNDDSNTNLEYLSKTERVVLECFSGEGLEGSLSSGELGKFQEVLDRALDSRKKLFGFLRWELFSKDKYYIKRVLVANDLTNNRTGFKKLVQRIDNRLNLEHNLTQLRDVKWLLEIPKEKRKIDFQNWFNDLKGAVKARDLFYSVRNFKDYFNAANYHYDEFYELVDNLYTAIEELPPLMNNWLQYFTTVQISEMNHDLSLADLMLSTLNMDFDALCEFDNLVENLSAVEHKVLDKIYEFKDEIKSDEAVALFQNSLRTAWIDHIEMKYPELRYTGSGKFSKLIDELQDSVEKKQQLSNEILLLKARERTYENAEFNRLKNMVTYRELYHQVTKKRRIWPIRKLFGHYHEELFELIPCWMASPESVSAVFPMIQLFDIVIFDEASQCFAERGIPAVYRGKQLIVAGDSKQLQPNDLYQIRWDDEESDDPDLEVDSLLDLVSPYLMSVQLNGHYRSKSPDLIDFSNQHFYNGRLNLLPDKNIVNLSRPAITYLHVDGIWESNCNLKEAEKVMELIFEIGHEQPDLSIGIVTFNVKQQNLIMDMLDDEAANGKLIPKNLIVKNIENIQGDERDVIIFSTAYANDRDGKFIMQFGSLNAPGGENRLNVAITRSKEKIYIVSSIFANQLKVDDLKNDGPKLLKAYLQYAHDVSEGNYTPVINSKENHNPSWYLKTKLKSEISKDSDAGIGEEMPFADLTIKKNGKYAGLILTDDDLYFQSASVKEDYVYKPGMLKSKNWDYITVESREYWRNSDKINEEVRRFIYKSTTPLP